MLISRPRRPARYFSIASASSGWSCSWIRGTRAMRGILLDLRRRLHHGAQLGRDPGHDAEPGVEGSARLVDQHAGPVDGGIAARSRGGEQRRLARNIDDVADQRVARKLIER